MRRGTVVTKGGGTIYSTEGVVCVGWEWGTLQVTCFKLHGKTLTVQDCG